MDPAAGGWYDGVVYQRFIEPFLHEVHHAIATMVRAGSVVVDVGSGTGRLASVLSPRCAKVVGIESSTRMLAVARQELRETGRANVAFIEGNALDCNIASLGFVDHAIFSFCLHEMDPAVRRATTRRFAGIAGTIIIAEFEHPSPWNGFNLASTVTESLSNARHFSNYLTFMAAGGIDAFLRREGLVPGRRWRDGWHRFTVIEATSNTP